MLKAKGLPNWFWGGEAV
jgi:hypothetical protein